MASTVEATAHTDHPLRHFDRTCPACVADEARADTHGDAVYKAISAYVADYDFRGDDGDHTPTEGERILIEDAIMGLLADDDFLSAFKALHHSPSSSIEATEPTPHGYKLVRADVLAWLHGEAPHPDTGEWFERPQGEGAYWWRSRLRAATCESGVSRA